MSSDAPRLAVLIDADNTSPKVAGALFLEIAKLGEASVRRIYGDFSSDQLKGWSRILAQHAIIPHQQFAYTTGKNSSDIALVIDAMDLLHTGRFDGFCLVSSDSDFTRLASRIREQGVDVYGFGGRKTPVAFRQACKRFFYTENLAAGAEPLAAEGDAQALPDAAALVRKAMEDMTDDDGWVALGVVGQRLGNIAPDFDARSYGCSKLIEVIEKTGAFEIERQEGRAVRIREKPAGGRATGRRRGGRRAAARAEREEARRPSEARTPPRAEGDGGAMQPDETAAMAEPDAPAVAQQPPKAPKRRRARKSAEPDAPAPTPEAAADAAPQSDAAPESPDKAAAEDKPAPADEAAEAAPKPRARRRTRKADAPKAEAAETGTAAAETADAPGGGDGSEAEAAPKPRARRRARKDQATEPDGADASATDASAAEAKAPEASAPGTHAAEPPEPKTDAAEASAADAPAEAPKPRRRATRKRAAANAPEGPAPAEAPPASDAKPARRSRAGAKAKPAEGRE